MTAVIYARYSSDNQREESIEGQIRECTAYAEKNGITIVKHYIDRAISAKTDNRPQFQQMIKDSDKKLFDIVLVWKLDRFARNRYDSARYKTQLKKNGVKLMSATEIISEGPEGIILESVLEAMQNTTLPTLPKGCPWTDREHPERPLQRWSWNVWIYAGFRAEISHRPACLPFRAGIVHEVSGWPHDERDSGLAE